MKRSFSAVSIVHIVERVGLAIGYVLEILFTIYTHSFAVRLVTIGCDALRLAFIGSVFLSSLRSFSIFFGEK